MASTSRGKISESSSRCMFFKFIYEGIANEQKLRIPPEFTKKYGEHLPKLVFLKVPTGAVWKVELVDYDGHVWLQNGWQEFKEFYSIYLGHFLVFRYDGNSHFHVLIFDPSASEIEYPVSASHVEQTNTKRRKVCKTEAIELDHDCIKISDDFPTCQTRERKKDVSSKIKINSDEKFRALQRAKAYKSEDPFIVILMQPSYVIKKSSQLKLSVPLAFVQKYLAGKRNIILRVSDGRTWTVKIYLGANNAKLTSGWKSFVEDNHLKVGDVCVFQLIKGREPSLEVIIF